MREARQDTPAQPKGTDMNATVQELIATFGFAELTLADLVGLNAALRGVNQLD